MHAQEGLQTFFTLELIYSYLYILLPLTCTLQFHGSDAGIAARLVLQHYNASRRDRFLLKISDVCSDRCDKLDEFELFPRAAGMSSLVRLKSASRMSRSKAVLR